MKAIFQTGYGSPDFFEQRETKNPRVNGNDVLVNVHAAALHAGDMYIMRGIPKMVKLVAGFPKPKRYIPGYDVAGIVEEVGEKVTQFQPGNEIFGTGKSTCAELVSIKEDKTLHKPSNLTMIQAAAMSTSALPALQGLRDIGKIKQGQKVLINGASGGVGTFAVQIAKAFGAEVTGVCSTRNLELVKSIGADHVIDYTKQDFTKSDQKYDLILDQVANHTLADCRRRLTPNGLHIPNSGNSGLGYIIKAFLTSLIVRQQAPTFLSIPKKQDLIALKELVESGKILPVIDKVYSFSQTQDAFRYIEETHPSGKVVIDVMNKS